MQLVTQTEKHQNTSAIVRVYLAKSALRKLYHVSQSRI